MQIDDDELLKTYRTPGTCEICGAWCKMCEPFHFMSRGAGGSDIPLNLLKVGQTISFQCACHRKWHDGNIPKERVLEIIARREGLSPERVQQILWDVRNAPKELMNV